MARYSIGRSRENDIVLSDTTVSRQHAEIEDLGGGRFIVRDVGSSRGTLVQRGGNWEDVTETEITADQPILLGELETNVGALLQEAGIAVSAPAAGADASVASAASATPSSAAQASSGGGLSPAAKWTLIGGGIFFVVAVVTAVVLVLVLGDGKGGGLAGGSGGGTGGTSTGTGGGGGTTSSNTAFQRACETRMARSPRTQPIAGKICTCIVDGVRKSSAISDADRSRILKIKNLNSQPQQVSPQSQQAFLKIVIACAKRFRRSQ